MIRLHLVFKQLSEDKATLSLPLTFRVVFLIIALLLAFSMISVKAVHPAPLILFALTLIGGMYKEMWILDNTRKTIVHSSGLLFLYRNKTIPYESIREMTLINHREIDDTDRRMSLLGRRRMVAKSLARLEFLLADGNRQTVEIQENRKSSELKETAEKVSAFMGVPLNLQD